MRGLRTGRDLFLPARPEDLLERVEEITEGWPGDGELVAAVPDVRLGHIPDAGERRVRLDPLERGPPRPLLSILHETEERETVAGTQRITTGLAA